MAGMLLFPLETAFLRQALLQKREGCTLTDAVLSVKPASRTRKRALTLMQSSRIARRDSAYVLWRTQFGEYWAPDGDQSLFFVLAELELEPYGQGRQGASPGDVILDCGAHLGAYTRQALAAGAALVVAIEPGPQQIECLRRTFQQEVASGRVVIRSVGVWNTEGYLSLHQSGDTAVSSVVGSGAVVAGSIAVTTVDRIVSELNLRKLDLIKMDIEGAEQQALEGSRDTLRRFKPRLAIAAYHNLQDHKRIPAVVSRANPSYRFDRTGCRLDLGVTVPLTLFFY